MERSVKIDFFNFTTRRTLTEVLNLFSSLPNPLTPQEKGLYGYKLSFVSPDGVTVLFSADRPDVHIQITGRGCDALRLRELDPCNLLSPGDHVTRLDVAIDCINSGFACSDIWRLLQRGQFVSVSSDIRQIEGVMSRGSRFERINRNSPKPKATTRTNSGHTIYVGASSSDRMVRIYDKGAEQETGTDWLRFEIQLRRDSAIEFYRLLAAGGDLHQLSLGLLNKQLRLLADGEELTRERSHRFASLKLHPMWEKITSMVSAVKLCVSQPAKSVSSTLRYVKNASASIKALKLVMSDFDEFFADLIENAKLKSSHIAVQDDYMQTYLSGYSDGFGLVSPMHV